LQHQEYHQLQGSHNMQLQVAFANLTSLSLSDWCLIDNCKALLYLLEHAPKLEQFTLVMTKVIFSGLLYPALWQSYVYIFFNIGTAATLCI
jgi:hypothetical protein